MLEDTIPDDRAAAVDGVVSAMHSIWFDSWGPRMELILRHACRVLIEAPNGSLLLLPRLLTDDKFRAGLVERVSDPLTRAFFGARFEKWRDTYRDEAIEPVLNKTEAFLAFDAIRNSLGQSKSSLHLPYAMDHGRIVIVNLASGVVGETAARLFGALLLGRLRTAAMARAKIPADKRRPFHLLIDEAQAFGPASIASLLSEVRKYSCSVTVATQFLDGLADTTRAALLGNAGTFAVFRCAPQDAGVLAPNFDRAQQSFNAYALQNLTVGEAMVRSLQLDPASVSIPAPGDVHSTDAVRSARADSTTAGRARRSRATSSACWATKRLASPARSPATDRWPLSLRVLRTALSARTR